jgi:hypothetical protein
VIGDGVLILYIYVVASVTTCNIRDELARKVTHINIERQRATKTNCYRPEELLIRRVRAVESKAWAEPRNERVLQMCGNAFVRLSASTAACLRVSGCHATPSEYGHATTRRVTSQPAHPSPVIAA